MFSLSPAAHFSLASENLLYLAYHFSSGDLRRPAHGLDLRQRVYNHQLRCIAPVTSASTLPRSNALHQMRRVGKRRVEANISARQNDLVQALKARAHSTHMLAYLCVEAGVYGQLILLENKLEHGTRYRTAQAPQLFLPTQLCVSDFDTPVLRTEGTAYRFLQNGEWQASTDFYRALQATNKPPCNGSQLERLRETISAYANKHCPSLQCALLDIDLPQATLGKKISAPLLKSEHTDYRHLQGTQASRSKDLGSMSGSGNALDLPALRQQLHACAASLQFVLGNAMVYQLFSIVSELSHCFHRTPTRAATLGVRSKTDVTTPILLASLERHIEKLRTALNGACALDSSIQNELSRLLQLALPVCDVLAKQMLPQCQHRPLSGTDYALPPSSGSHRSGAMANAAASALNLLNTPHIALTLEKQTTNSHGNTLAILGMLALFDSVRPIPRGR